jgi:hypothetical protein
MKTVNKKVFYLLFFKEFVVVYKHVKCRRVKKEPACEKDSTIAYNFTGQRVLVF